MGKVAILIKIMPESPESDIEKIKADASKIVEIKDAKIEPLAFGLKSLKFLVITEDEGAEEVERKLGAIKGVGSVEVESVTLI